MLSFSIARTVGDSYTRKIGIAVCVPWWGMWVFPRRVKGVVVRERRRSEGGAAAVEFALVMPLFVALLFGMLEFGWYFWTAETTSSAARETTRRIIVGDCWANPNAFAVAHGPRVTGTVLKDENDAPIASPAGLEVGDTIKVELTANSDLINFFPLIPNTVKREYVARMEDTSDNGAC